MSNLQPNGRGGDGGSAIASGHDSSAAGGNGGKGGLSSGGRGGDAVAKLDNCVAIGGDGGNGGVTPGGDGGSVHLGSDPPPVPSEATPGSGGGVLFQGDMSRVTAIFAKGGNGGEAGQPDGRGGRGGRSGPVRGGSSLKRPWWLPVEGYGHGGDGQDTNCYRARKLILESVKATLSGKTYFFTEDVWYDTTTDINAINAELFALGHKFKVEFYEDEYIFSDLPS